MGLTPRNHTCAPQRNIPPFLSADWPVWVFYGLVTFYQGLFGLSVPSSIFYVATADTPGAFIIVAVLMLTGLLLLVDGLIAMVHYCTHVDCRRAQPAMRLFHRWRHLLFLPPVFCYYATFVIIGAHARRGMWVVLAYYVTLALMGVALCLRDALITQKTRHKGAVRTRQKHA